MDFDVPEYGAITIDTSIFHRHGFKMETGLLSKLAQFRHGNVRLVLSEIVVKEVKSHLEQRIAEAQTQVRKAKKLANEQLLVSSEKLAQVTDTLLASGSPAEIAQTRIDVFLHDYSVEIVAVGGRVDIDTVIERYFASKAPFSNCAKKKSEFPDAFALLSLENWARAKNTRMLSISTDGDWKRFCSESDQIDNEEDLAEALSLFQSHNFASVALERLESALLEIDHSDVTKALETYLSDVVANFDISPEASSSFHYDYEVEEVYFQSFNPVVGTSGRPIIRVVDVEDRGVALDCQIEITFEAACSFEFSVKDSVDKDYVKIGTATVRREVEFETGALIDICLSEDLQSFEILTVELTESIDRVDFGEVGPEWDYDDTYDRYEDFL